MGRKFARESRADSCMGPSIADRGPARQQGGRQLKAVYRRITTREPIEHRFHDEGECLRCVYCEDTLVQKTL